MRKVITWVLVLTFSFLVCDAFADAVLDAALKDVKMKAGLVKSYSADVKMSVKMSKTTTLQMTGKMLCKGDKKIKVDMDVLGGTQPIKQLTVCDGVTIWQYMKPMEVVYKVDLKKNAGEMGDIRDVTRDIEESTMKFVKKDNSSGEFVYIIEGEPKAYISEQDPEKYVKMEIHIGLADGLVRRVVMKDVDGNPTIIEEYKNIKTNIPIDDKEFDFKIPAGAKLEER